MHPADPPVISTSAGEVCHGRVGAPAGRRCARHGRRRNDGRPLRGPPGLRRRDGESVGCPPCPVATRWRATATTRGRVGPAAQGPGSHPQLRHPRCGPRSVRWGRRSRRADCVSVPWAAGPHLHVGCSESNPLALTSRSTSRTRSRPVDATSAIVTASLPCADSGTICAGRWVRLDPPLRRTMRGNVVSSAMVRTCTRCTSTRLLGEVRIRHDQRQTNLHPDRAPRPA